MICHPDVFLKRWIVLPNGKDKAKLPCLNSENLQRHKVNLFLKKGPSLITENKIKDYDRISDSEINNLAPNLLITGQIPRHTIYEKRFLLQYKEDPTKGNLIPDPLVNDDQAIVANIKDKGLVLLVVALMQELLMQLIMLNFLLE